MTGRSTWFTVKSTFNGNAVGIVAISKINLTQNFSLLSFLQGRSQERLTQKSTLSSGHYKWLSVRLLHIPCSNSATDSMSWKSLAELDSLLPLILLALVYNWFTEQRVKWASWEGESTTHRSLATELIVARRSRWDKQGFMRSGHYRSVDGFKITVSPATLHAPHWHSGSDDLVMMLWSRETRFSSEPFRSSLASYYRSEVCVAFVINDRSAKCEIEYMQFC